MSLIAGSRLGPYEILAPLGAGGMGEVWRARDTKLGREVALKVLPAALATDAERLARFEREAQLLAALNHPHIAAIHGVEDSTDVKALVLELVEGPTLQDRLSQGALPVEETIAVARQIAEALEAAHEKGIVHRDLKPANIKLTTDGNVKVLDFGLAKALDPSASSGSSRSTSPTLMNSPTLTAANTQLGVILGTAAYMAPEQAKGAAVDKRADIWAFGVVLHEMLTGERLFAGDSAAETLAGVLKTPLDFGALPASTPPSVRRLLRQCLERNPKNRLHDMADARLALDEAVREPAAAALAPAAGSRRGSALLVAGALAVGLAAGILADRALRRPAPVASGRWALALPEGMAFSSLEYPQLALSEDGRTQVTAVVDASGVRRLLLRSQDEFAPRLMAETERANTPFFSPDGDWVGFYRDNALWKVAVAGGSPIHLAEATAQTRGATWSRDGFIYFAPDTAVGLSRIPERGGPLATVTTLDAGRDERTHRWPQVLPDGSAIVFTCDTQTSTEYYDDARIEAVRVATGERVVLVEGSSQARYSPSGHLVFARGGSLFAVAFDARRLAVTGKPVLVAQGVVTDIGSGAVQFALAANGDGLWVPGGTSVSYRMEKIDANGMSSPLPLSEAPFNEAALSPDGRMVALIGGEGGVADLWVADLERGAVTRVTTGETVAAPVWSPDSRRVAYLTRARTGDAGRWQIVWQSADGSLGGEVLVTATRTATPSDITDDGSELIYEVLNPEGTAVDIYAVPLTAPHTPRLVLGGRDFKGEGQLSPDGRWLAYTHESGGQSVVFVRRYPSGEGRWQISTPQGLEPRWSVDGRRLYYRFDRALYQVAIDTSSGFAASRPERQVDFVATGVGIHTYTPTSDGGLVTARSPQETAALRVVHLELGFARRLTELTGEGALIPMTLAAGSRLGPYEIVSPLGAGGMGEVWRARDTKLGREVALKVLPQTLAQDSERLQRFEREAQLLASLNHPHIAAIYGVEDSTATKALVLELVEGPTLQERIAHGALPMAEAISIARQVAEALEAAHERGVIHRDLKPANVKLTLDDSVKVLDFGLAKALDPGAMSALSPSASPTLMHSPTLTAAGTQLGVILGTAAYMAPEQARGKAVDRRADIWALGCLIWEMLTGQRLYEGETVSDTIAAVLTRAPEWSALPAGTPAALRELLRRLLERDPKNRLHDVADARISLDEIATGRLPEPAATSRALPAHPVWRATPWAIALLALGVAGWAAWRGGRAREIPALRFAISSPEGTTVAFEDNYPSLDVSLDGRRLAFIARDERGTRHLYVRELGEIEPREIPGGLEARAPFFSPDGKSLGFFTFGELKRVSLDGGAPAVLAQVENPRGGAWVDDSTIVFPTATDSPLYRLSASGGAAVPLTTLDAARNERTHRWPAPLPGGVLFACDTFESTEFYDDARIEAVSLDGARRAVVVERSSFARYLPSGELIFARGGSLYAVRFDARTFRTQGEPVLVWQGVSTRVSSGAVQFAATPGILAYVAGGLSTESGSVAWFRRDGPAEALDIPQANQVQQVRLSPDGAHLAIVTSASPTADLWNIDLARSMSNRLSFEGNSWDPVFSPDGKSVAFASARGGFRYRPYLKAADGGGAERLLWESEEPAFPSSFSPDGKWLALEVRSRSSASDIWMLPLDGSAPPRPFLATRDIEWQPAFSPDGKWLAYASNASGTTQVYVRPFPGPGGLWQLSTGGGEGPRWSSDGRKIYFRFELDIYEIDVDTSHGFAAGQPRRILGGTVATTFNNSFDVTADGERFIALHTPPERERRQISVLLDWPAQLRRALGR